MLVTEGCQVDERISGNPSLPSNTGAVTSAYFFMKDQSGGAGWGIQYHILCSRRKSDLKTLQCTINILPIYILKVHINSWESPHINCLLAYFLYQVSYSFVLLCIQRVCINFIDET